MRVRLYTPFVLVFALNVAQIMQICGDTKYDYEILSVEEYTSLAAKRDISQGKVVLQCGFDNDWCGFKNEQGNDDFNWTITSKRTPSAGTGPYRDMSGRGSYIYIEASIPRRRGNTARLTSPVFPPMVYCLQFGVHARGANIGSLAVYKKRLGSDGREMMLKLDKNYGRKWQYVSVTVVHFSSFVIEFEGVCGHGYRGDIALDNITLAEGKCASIDTGRNHTDLCGYGYPGLTTNTIPRFPVSFHAWPWFVWLSSIGQSQPTCSAVQVSRDWLLTTAECAQKFKKNEITTYRGMSNVNKSERKNILKIEQRSTNTLQKVLLKLDSSTSSRADQVCLPSSFPLQYRVRNCYLLAIADPGHKKRFVESPAIVLSSAECRRDIQTASKTNPDLKQLLCVQVRNSASFNDSLHTGHLVCKNHILDRWILQAMGSFSKTDFKNNILVLPRVSFDVEWIDNITNVPMLIPGIPVKTIPSLPQAFSNKSFQIMEKLDQECLTLESDEQKFSYKPCNDFDTRQRFEWTQGHRLVAVHTNSCVEIDGTHLRYLRVDRCTARRRSQQWACKGNTIFNAFYNGYITLKSNEDSGFVRLSRAQEIVGHFVIFRTHDSLCALRPTVRGVLKCDFNRHRMCGFDGQDTSAQFMWRVPRTGSTDFKDFPYLVSTDKFFRIVHRTNGGTPTAVLRSPQFHGQRCAQFRLFLQGSSFNQLNIYKDGGGQGKLVFQINATTNAHRWSFHRVTIVPTAACETFQVVFKAVFSDFSKSKVAIRDVIISPGLCRRHSPQRSTDGKCLKGWKLVNGKCMYFHDTKVTWYEASAVCRIADAELLPHTAASTIIPRGSRAWIGVRSCPTGRLYSVHGVRYTDTKLFSMPACLQLHKPRNGATIYQTSQCDLELPFACQKDPGETRGTCGWRNTSAVLPYKQWSWHVMIIAYSNCVCGGTLVAPGYVVTSTLCLSRVSLYAVKIFFPSSRKMIRKITNIINHPMSGIKSGDNDISIVMFEDDEVQSFGPSVHFACVKQTNSYWKHGNDNFLKDKKCVVLGWWTSNGSPGFCGPKQYATQEVELVDRKECREYYGEHTITDRMICAKARQKTPSTCLGVTGGPLVCDIAGTWTLVGVTSWGVGCSPTRKYGIYTDVGSMKPWIDTVLRENQ